MDNIFSLVKIAPSFIEACKLARKDFDKQLIEKGYQIFSLCNDNFSYERGNVLSKFESKIAK